MKFKDSKVSEDLIKTSENFEKFGQKDPIIDLELHNRRLIVLSALRRTEIAEKTKEKEKSGVVIDLKKIRTISELTQYDKLGKRRIQLAELGIFDPEDAHIKKGFLSD